MTDAFARMRGQCAIRLLTRILTGLLLLTVGAGGLAAPATTDPTHANPLDTLDTFDLIDCKALPFQTNPKSPDSIVQIGIASPAEPGFALQAAQLAQSRNDLTVCRASWSAVLPLTTPFAKVHSLEKYYGWCAFLLALIVTLFLAAHLTPRHWWTRPTVTGLLIVGLGCWGGGVLLLMAANQWRLPQQWVYADVVSLQRDQGKVQWLEVDGMRGLTRQLALAGAPDAPATREAGAREGYHAHDVHDVYYRVHQPLNLRQAAGIDAPRIATLGRGANVRATGRRTGDWWQVEATVEGLRQTGWVSSLWLR